MRFDYVLIGFLLFTFFIVSGLGMIYDFNDKYTDVGANISSSELESFENTTNEIYDIAGQAKSNIENNTVDSGSAAWESMTTGSYSAIRLIFKAPSIFSKVFNSIINALNLPPSIALIGMTIFIILLVFSIVYCIFRFIPR